MSVATNRINGHQPGLTGPVPPHSEDAEKSVLGSILIDPCELVFDDVAAIISPDDFYVPRHQTIYRAICELIADNVPVDAVTLGESLEHDDQLEEIGGYLYLEELVKFVPHSAHAEYYAKIVHEKADVRRALRKAQHFTRAAYERQNEPEQLQADFPEFFSGSQRENRFTFFTAGELSELEFHTNYFVDGILAAGGIPSIMAGSFKTLKTSIGMDLAISIATGSPFLGTFEVLNQAKVAILNGESGMKNLQNLAFRVCDSKGWYLGALKDRLLISDNLPNLADGRDMAELRRFVEKNKIELLVVDPVYLAMRSVQANDSGSMFRMGDMLEPLSKIGQDTGCTPLIVHHNKRAASNLYEPAELSDIAWAGFAEWAGQWILLSRREKYDADSDGEHRLWLTAGGRDGHSTNVAVDVTEGRLSDQGGRRWQVDVESASGSGGERFSQQPI
ncbi:MAG: replicative DNA helicase [Planctomycetaceae bacterium]